MKTRELFEKHGLRCTKQRVALYEALRQSMDHPTAEDLYRAVRPLTSRLSRATVYNTLEALCSAGLARRLPTTHGCSRYDADIMEHLHFRCRETSEIRDVPPELGQRLLKKLPREVLTEIERCMGVCIEGVNIQLLGRSAVTAKQAE